MLIDAILLIQDVQLLCFTIIFGFVALQHWEDQTRRWLWYSFLANAAGALTDFLGGHLPLWIGRGINMEMIPLSYMLINVAVVRFMGRFHKTQWVSIAIVVCTLPLFLMWSGHPVQYPTDSLVDLSIALQAVITGVILLRSSEESTRSPRVLMGTFLLAFSVVEFARAFVAFVVHQDPDIFSKRLELTSSVAYIVSTSVLPLAFIWMINSRLEADLKRQTMLDPLTQVLNRRGLRQVLDREVSRYARYGYPLSVALIDLDRFKQLNDTYGHATGDAVLVGVADLIVALLRKTDVVARIGGEEFVLVLPHTDDVAAEMLLERIREGVETSCGTEVATTVTASFGFSSTRQRAAVEAMDLLGEADKALYRAKESGRNRIVAFTAEDDVQALPERLL
jgi:diguanylate cyclase (GGDEF)-like protein